MSSAEPQVPDTTLVAQVPDTSLVTQVPDTSRNIQINNTIINSDNKQDQKRSLFNLIRIIVRFIVESIQGAAKFLVSLFGLVILLFVLYIIYIFIFKAHPRLFFLCRWSPFDSYMSGYISDMQNHFETITAFSQSGATNIKNMCYSVTGNRIMDHVQEIIPEIDALSKVDSDEMVMIFKFWNALKTPYGFISKIDLTSLDENYLNEGDVDLTKSSFKQLVANAELMGSLKDKVKNVKDMIDNSEYMREDSNIIGCNDLLKLKWTKLFLQGRISESDDATLLALHSTLKDIQGTDLWALHLKTDVCEARPLTPNERIYMEIKQYNEKCQNKAAVIEWIDLVLADPQSALVETTEIFDCIMAIYELDLMLNYYLYDIKVGYETRKGGFKLNFVILRYFLWPYIQWALVVKIFTQVWGKFGERFVLKLKSTFIQFLEWWASIPLMLVSLPMTLAGENFQQHTDPNYKVLTFLNNVFGKKDTVEHFGFLKGLISVGDFFKGILDAVTALMFMITQPLKFLMMLIGFVIALLIMILYILNTVFFLQFIYGAIWAVIMVIIPAIWFTIFYLILIVPISVWFIFLWLLDLITGGLIMALFRCENNPDKWYKYPSYAYGNSYYRMFFCTFRCAENYDPWTFLGIFDFCTRIPKMKPAFCPQQNIFKIYKNELVSTNSHYKDFEINLKTANMTKDQRMQYLTRIKLSREEFKDSCKYCFENDVNMDSMFTTTQSYNHITRFLCKYTGQLAKNNPLRYKQICDICTNMYGGDLPAYGHKNTFNTTEYAKEDESEGVTVEGFSSSDEISKSILMLIGCIIFITFISYMINTFKYKNTLISQ